MFDILLKKRFPQTTLDVISFVVLFSYFYVGIKAPVEVALLYCCVLILIIESKKSHLILQEMELFFV